NRNHFPFSSSSTIPKLRFDFLYSASLGHDPGSKRTNQLYTVGLSARVESSDDNEDLGEDASKQGRKIQDIDADEDITLVNDQDDEKMFDVNDLQGEEVFVQEDVASEVNVASIATTDSVAATMIVDEVTLAQALMKIKKEPVKLKKKDQIMLNQEVALKLQAELQAKFDKEQRLASEKAQQEEEANIALIETLDDVQEKIDVDYQLAERLQAEEQQELNDAVKATLFMKLLEKRRKFFAAKRVEEKRNKPPTRAQQKSIMCEYLYCYQTELVEESSKKAKAEVMKGSSKRASTEMEQENSKLEQESSKKQKIDDDKETAELKQLVKIIPDEEGVAFDAIPLAVKPPSIVDWKIHKEGKKRYYKIIRADESSKIYLVFSHMLKCFNREDVETLWKLVKAKHGSTRPEEDYERVL
nr:hypothetical protein [Tanacetum cinerariifolium]